MLQRMAMKIVILLLPFIQCEGSDLYCDPRVNKYYEPKYDLCLFCPKCPKGMAPRDIDESNFKVEYREGPTECRSCIDCKFGTFSNNPSYKCTVCTNCAMISKVEQAECTQYEDAICEERLTEYGTRVENITRNIKIDDNLKDRNSKHYTWVILLSFCCTVVVAAMFVAFFFVHRVKKRRKHRMVFLSVISPANKEEQVPMNQRTKTDKNETTMDPEEQNDV